MKFLSAITLLVLFLLPACGFHPIYGSSSETAEVADALNDISIDNIPNREGQMLRNDLIDRMYGKGRPQNPSYKLEIKFRFTEDDVGILQDTTATRTIMNSYANYFLRDMNGKLLSEGTAHSITTFTKLSDQYATLAAHEDALQRSINEVSEQLVSQLSLYLSEKPEAPAPTTTR